MALYSRLLLPTLLLLLLLLPLLLLRLLTCSYSGRKASTSLWSKAGSADMSSSSNDGSTCTPPHTHTVNQSPVSLSLISVKLIYLHLKPRTGGRVEYPVSSDPRLLTDLQGPSSLSPHSPPLLLETEYTDEHALVCLLARLHTCLPASVPACLSKSACPPPSLPPSLVPACLVSACMAFSLPTHLPSSCVPASLPLCNESVALPGTPPLRTAQCSSGPGPTPRTYDAAAPPHQRRPPTTTTRPLPHASHRKIR